MLYIICSNCTGKCYHVTYRHDFHIFGDAVLPGEADYVRQVQGEVNDSTAGRCQVSLVEKHTHEEALHDGCCGESEQE